MKLSLPHRHSAPALFAGASVMALLLVTAARAQGPDWYAPAYGQRGCPPVYVPGCPSPYPSQPPQTNPPQTNPPQTNPPQTNVPQTNPPQTTAPSTEPETENPGMGAPGGETVALSPGGYLDDAIPQTLFRLRYESRFDINRFDRASYMYGTWEEGKFHTHALVGSNGTIRGLFVDPKATGSQIISDDIDDQTASAYLEFAFNERLSAFVDAPFRFVHFGANLEDAGETPAERQQFKEAQEVFPYKSTTDGMSDIDFGFKYALIEDPNNRYVTFQFRTYLPTGDPGLGLGTGHVSLEPSLLFFQRLTDRLTAQGQLTDWIPIAAGPGAGNVTEYGFGFGYDLIQTCKFRLTPVFETVGWTVLGGTEGFSGAMGSVPGTVTPAGANGAAPLVPAINVNGVFVPADHGFLEANGDTIVNLKFGVRTYFGDRSDLYVGYGHTVTGSRWYNDIFRAEYRIKF